jgi:hypothetical protein
VVGNGGNRVRAWTSWHRWLILAMLGCAFSPSPSPWLSVRLTGSIVLVSALFHPETMTGKPFALVSRPMVLCGPSLRSLENPLSGN